MTHRTFLLYSDRADWERKVRNRILAACGLALFVFGLIVGRFWG